MHRNGSLLKASNEQTWYGYGVKRCLPAKKFDTQLVLHKLNQFCLLRHIPINGVIWQAWLLCSPPLFSLYQVHNWCYEKNTKADVRLRANSAVY